MEKLASWSTVQSEVAKRLEMDVPDVQLDKTLEEMDIDSLGYLDLLCHLEEEFSFDAKRDGLDEKMKPTGCLKWTLRQSIKRWGLPMQDQG